ncbi:rCG22342 [Rattus norvegicus]|uniref:RCG22342 n=1 Tax=Rattus norvegicus TaxID=10116 RepID=A6IP02_RAT|nr:rCG22342 [Rattus norvegicus]
MEFLRKENSACKASLGPKEGVTKNYAVYAAGLKISKELKIPGLTALPGTEPKSREEGNYAMPKVLCFLP